MSSVLGTVSDRSGIITKALTFRPQLSLRWGRFFVRPGWPGSPGPRGIAQCGRRTGRGLGSLTYLDAPSGPLQGRDVAVADVRFAPHCGLKLDIAEGPQSASSGTALCAGALHADDASDWLAHLVRRYDSAPDHPFD